MSFDSSDRFSVDPSESQIAEGLVTQYAGNNSHRNCLPATAAQMVMAAGGPDIDPQQVIDEVYGVSHAAGSEWPPIIAWFEAKCPGFTFDYHPYFNFDLADQAGAAGRLIGISGWVDNGPTYNIVGEANGLSHASILWSHRPDDSFVMWNIWKGRYENYDRSTMAQTLYEMAVLTAPGSPEFVAQGGGQNNMQIIPRPSQPGRYDAFLVGADEAVWHVAGSLSEILVKGWESFGAKARQGSGVSATWSLDGQTLLVMCIGTDSVPYLMTLDAQTGNKSGWAKMYAKAG
jgi:hypothetical protein